MERRTFFQTSVAVGILGSSLPRSLTATRPARRPRPFVPYPIKLSSNENPLGISPKAKNAIIDGLVDANRYPGDTGRKVIAALSEWLGVPQEQIRAGAGSTEILRMVVQGLGTGGRLIVAEPTFEDAPGYGMRVDIPVDKVPLTSNWSHDIPRMRELASRGARTGPVIAYLCNPNNPTGTLTSNAEIDAWIGEAPENVYFALDEAYFELADSKDYWSGLKWVPDRPNVIVIRTFSKVFGMAGLRLGYAVAAPETLDRFEGIATRNIPNHLAGVAGVASLADREFYAKSLDVNRRGKQLLYDCLDDLEISYLRSETNFVMHRIKGDLETHNERMAEHGFRVGRPFPPMLDYSRVSIGLPEHMERYADTIREFRRKGVI